MGYKGFDVSQYQKKINWNDIPVEYSFAIIRAGWGVTEKNQTDTYFAANMTGAVERGLNIGVYWFLYALTVEDAIRNAESFLKVVEPYKSKIDFPLFLDVEGDTIRYMKSQGKEPSKNLISLMVDAFCKRIEDAGYYVAIYSDNNFINNWIHADLLQKYDLWFAYWVNIFNPEYCIRKCGVWQWTNTGTVPGISGRVDLNYTENDYPTIMKKHNLNFINGDPEPVPVSNTSIESGTVSETDTQIFIVLNKKVSE